MTEPTDQRRRQPQQSRTDMVRTDSPVVERAMEALHARQEQVGQLARIVQSSRSLFTRLLPTHIGVDTFMGAAGAALWKDDKLMMGAVQDPEAFLIALREAASLGHVPGTDHYWLTPRRRGGRESVLGIEGYQGIIERMYRAGGVLSVRSRVVREHDTFEPDGGPNGTPIHQFGGKRGAFSTREDRGQVIGVYAYAILPGGYASQVILMSIEDLMEHRAAATTKNVWDSWPEAMYRKTALRGLEPYVPTSVEYRQAAARHIAAIAAVAPTQAAPGRTEIEAGQDGDAPAATPSTAGPAPEAQPSGGVPVQDVKYDPQQWSGEVDGQAWEDLPVTRPGTGVPPEVQADGK